MSSRLIPISLSTVLLVSACGVPTEFSGISFPDENADVISCYAPSANTAPESSVSGLSALEIALETGSAANVDAGTLSQYALSFLNQRVADATTDKQAIFTNPDILGISWDPTHDSALLASTPSENFTLLLANDSSTSAGTDISAEALAVAGRYGNTPYAVFGGNPFRNSANMNESMQQVMRSTIGWLTNAPLAELDNVVLAHLDDSYWFRDYPNTKTWLEAEAAPGASLSDYQQCNNEALNACLSDDVDLLIVSQHMDENSDAEEIRLSVAAALDQGIPVLYLHWDGGLTDLGSQLLSLLKVTYVKDNYWSKQKLTNVDVISTIDQPSADESSLKNLISTLEGDTSGFTLANCDGDCGNQPGYASSFLTGARLLQQRLRNYDKNGVYLFDHKDYKLDKLLILLADKYRETITYPLSFDSSHPVDFVRASFADHAQYQRRSYIPVPADLGNYSRTSFDGIEQCNITRQYTSRAPFKAAGVYALPGQTVTVSRLDTSSVNTRVYVSSVRNGATHEWDSDGYKRPKYLQSQSMSIAPGETLSFTSTYGGPIQISFDAKDQNVSLHFQNVGQHPYWRSAEDDAEFQQALDAGLFDWAELATPGFEVHSKLEKMRESINNPYWPDGSSMAAATLQYTHNYPHVLAGFRGDGIDVVAEIHDFATDRGWTIDTLDSVKHMNADQAACGYGCSGNPYDAYWEFEPTGHGDIHELGHGLERDRFRMTMNGVKAEGHSTTNLYSYYSKSMFYRETGNAPSCQNLPFQTLYEELQSALASNDPASVKAGFDYSSWNKSVAVYIQMMMAAQAEGVVANGWHLWARLHLADREFRRADDNETNWLAKRDSLGMSQYDYATGKAISNNDWMLLTISLSTGRDYRPFFDLYGYDYSDAASAQLDAAVYPAIPATFFYTDGNDYCLGLDKSTLPLDGSAMWPEIQNAPAQ